MTYRIDPTTVLDERAELISYDDWDADDGPYQLANAIAERNVIYCFEAWEIVNAADGDQLDPADEMAEDCWDGKWEPIHTRMTRLAYFIVHAEVLRVLETLDDARSEV